MTNPPLPSDPVGETVRAAVDAALVVALAEAETPAVALARIEPHVHHAAQLIAGAAASDIAADAVEAIKDTKWHLHNRDPERVRSALVTARGRLVRTTQSHRCLEHHGEDDG